MIMWQSVIRFEIGSSKSMAQALKALRKIMFQNFLNHVRSKYNFFLLTLLLHSITSVLSSSKKL